MNQRVIAASGIFLLVGAGMVALYEAPKATPNSANASPAIQIGGPFSLIDGDGKRVTDRDFRGRFMLIYFGYTHCPDACPTTLNDMAIALGKLPAAARARVAPIFITVDPARDVPAVIGDYVHAFGPEFIGLTGSPEAIADAEQAYRVYAARHPLAHGDYAMDHSSILYVIGPDGNFAGIISDGAKPDDIAQRLQAFGA